MEFAFEPHIALPVALYEEALEFYQRVLGMRLVKWGEEESRLALGEVNFYLERAHEALVDAEGGPIETRTWFSFSVNDLAEARRVLADGRCRIQEHVTTTEGDNGLLVTDPFGMRFFLSQSRDG